MKKEYRILGLKIKNFGCIEVIEMDFDENLNVIEFVGDNDQGKTSILNAMYWLLAGKRAINDEIIKKDSDKMEAEIKLEGLTIRRIAKRGTQPRLIVTNDEGFEMKKTQEFLDTLFTKLTFNPWPFINMTRQERLEAMMKHCKIDFSIIDQEIDRLIEERRDIGVQKKGLGELNEAEKAEYIDTEKLIEEKNRIQKEIEIDIENKREFNDLQENKRANIEDIMEKINLSENSIKNWNDEIIEIKEKMKIAENGIAEYKIELNKILEPEPLLELVSDLNTKNIDEKIRTASDQNDKYYRYQNYLEKKKNFERLDSEYKKYSEKIENLRTEKKTMLQKADTGVTELKIKEDGIYYKDILFENTSESEKMEIVSKLCKAQEKPLRAVCIDGAEAFGRKKMEALKKFANENNFQIFLTKVISDTPENIPPGTFYIEAGKVYRK